jgi:TolB-like protein
VLPFVNMSGDTKNDYFSDGITEEILDALAQLPNLKVAARTSAFAFKGKDEDLRKVGEVLDVATVMEGSVQQSGDEVRITAQLIDTRSGYHLWSEKYDRKLTSIFAVEDEISKAIADKLKVQMTGADGQSLVEQKPIDPLAHDFYLRGLTLLAARSMSETVAAFQQAVAIDPDYAQAWAALAEAEVLLPAIRWLLHYPPTPARWMLRAAHLHSIPICRWLTSREASCIPTRRIGPMRTRHSSAHWRWRPATPKRWINTRNSCSPSDNSSPRWRKLTVH